MSKVTSIRGVTKFGTPLEYSPNTKKYIVTKRFGVIELTYGPDALWRDQKGTVFALRRDSGSFDKTDRCGVYPVVMPFKTALDLGCKVHDYLYESPVFQLFHTRLEADEYFRILEINSTKKSSWKILVTPFYYIARWFGASAWENKLTNN